MSEEPYSEVHEWELSVPEGVIDENGHVNNVAYVQWMQDVAIRHFTELGGEELMQRFGATWVARSHQVEYLRPVFAGEILLVRTWVAGMEKARSMRRYEFTKEGTIVARGATDWVLIDGASGRPKRIPDEMKEAVRRK